MEDSRIVLEENDFFTNGQTCQQHVCKTDDNKTEPEPKQTKPNRVQQMTQIQQAALALFTRKNADYGDAFAQYGVIGVLVRLQDKINRCLSISQSGIQLVEDERLEDTLMDLHNYAAMALMLMQE